MRRSPPQVGVTGGFAPPRRVPEGRLSHEVGRLAQFARERLRPGSYREALLAALLAAASVALLRAIVPFGIDSAAHAYQTLRFLRSGFSFWDNYWYDGRYSLVDYSLLYYPIAGLIGRFATVALTLAASGFLFARLVSQRFGAASRWPSRLFAAAAAGCIWISGEYPFALGMALGLAALALARHRRLPLAALAALATLLASPLAFLLLMMAFAGIVLGAGSASRVGKLLLRRIDLIVGLGLCGLVAAALQLDFPVTGAFHFNFWALFQVLAMGAVALLTSVGLRGVGVIRSLFVAMAIAAIAAYLVPSPLGGNATRLIDYVGAPLIWILAARQRIERHAPRALVAGVCALVLGGQLAPTLVSAGLALDPRAESPRFWRGAIAFLHAHTSSAFRVEALDTAGHWEAYYLPAAGVPIVRGWFRQDDFPHDALLYRRSLQGPAYRAWLRENAVDYVLAPHDSLDYSSIAEASLLRSGRSGLRLVYRDRFTTIFALPDPMPLLRAPRGRSARVLRVGHASLTLHVSGAGRYPLAVNYTPYWQLSPRSSACISSMPDGFSAILATHAGTFTLRFEPTLGSLLLEPAPACG
jgi:hypothetical protein